MNTKSKLNRALAIVGTVLVGFPLIAPFAFGVVALFDRGDFLFDYLMPAEFFPLILAGGVLLTWVAYRAGTRLRPIAAGLGSAIFFLAATQGTAMVTGLAHGDAEPAGWRLALVVTLLALYAAAVAALGVAGALLVGDLSRPGRPHPTA